MAKKPEKHTSLFQSIKLVIDHAKSNIVRSVNFTLIVTYFEIGKIIVKNEQEGNFRAAYARETLQLLSKSLIKEFGRGYSVDNLERFRKFYITYSVKKSASLMRKSKSNTKSASLMRKSKTFSLASNFQNFTLSWTHYVQLLRIDDEKERDFYEIESIQNNWSVRELQRQYNSALYQRLALSKDKKGIKKLAQRGQVLEKATDALKTAYVLEFLDLKEENHYTENDLETAIINKLEHFMLELGKGFCFVGRQKRFTFEGEDFFADLVFYNRLLKCFVIIDLKIGKLNHQDIGQMQMYVNYYDRIIKSKEENPTMGIILCRQENKAVVEFTFPEGKKQIFTKEYKLYLPSKEALIRQLQ